MSVVQKRRASGGVTIQAPSQSNGSPPRQGSTAVTGIKSEPIKSLRPRPGELGKSGEIDLPRNTTEPVCTKEQTAAISQLTDATGRRSSYTSAEKKAEAESSESQKVSKIINVFRAFDVNADGVMDKSELMRLMWSLNPAFTENELDVVFAEVDGNGDGFIQYEEFVKWLYGDNDALARLKVPTKTPRSLNFSIYSMSGQVHVVNATPKDTIRDLRLRACVPLGVALDRVEDLHLRWRSETLCLSDDLKIQDLPSASKDMQAVLDNHGQLFAACGKCLYGFLFTHAPEIKLKIEADAEVRHLCYDRESGVVCAIVGRSSAVAWHVKTRAQAWAKTTKTSFTSMASRGATVYLGTEQDLLAVDMKTGKKQWSAAPSSQSSAICVVHAGPDVSNRVYALTESGSVLAWDANTGRQLWESQHGVADRDTWYLVGATGDDATHTEALYSGSSRGSVVSWDSRTGKQLWRFKQQQSQDTQALFYREHYDTLCVTACNCMGAAAGTKAPLMSSLDGRTGKTLWAEEAGDVLFLQGLRQYLFSASAKRVQAWDTLNKNMAWEVDLLSPDAGSITAFNFVEDLDALCIGTSEGLHLLDSKNGATRGYVAMKPGVDMLRYTPP